MKCQSKDELIKYKKENIIECINKGILDEEDELLLQTNFAVMDFYFTLEPMYKVVLLELIRNGIKRFAPLNYYIEILKSRNTSNERGIIFEACLNESIRESYAMDLLVLIKDFKTLEFFYAVCQNKAIREDFSVLKKIQMQDSLSKMQEVYAVCMDERVLSDRLLLNLIAELNSAEEMREMRLIITASEQIDLCFLSDIALLPDVEQMRIMRFAIEHPIIGKDQEFLRNLVKLDTWEEMRDKVIKYNNKSNDNALNNADQLFKMMNELNACIDNENYNACALNFAISFWEVMDNIEIISDKSSICFNILPIFIPMVIYIGEQRLVESDDSLTKKLIISRLEEYKNASDYNEYVYLIKLINALDSVKRNVRERKLNI